MKCPGNLVLDPSTHKCHCPLNLPHYTGTTCIACQDRQVWNADAKKCQYCPLSTPLFVNGHCQACPTGTHWDG